MIYFQVNFFNEGNNSYWFTCVFKMIGFSGDEAKKLNGVL